MKLQIESGTEEASRYGEMDSMDRILKHNERANERNGRKV